MKKSLLFLFLFGLTASMIGQTDFQKDLFSPDTVMKYRSKIDLNADQISAIDKITIDHFESFQSIKWDLNDAQEVLYDQLSQSNVNEVTTLSQMKKVIDLENKLKVMRLKMLIKVKNNLTEAQQIELKELRTTSDINNLKFVTNINDSQRLQVQVSKNLNRGFNPLYIIQNKEGDREVGDDFIKDLDPNQILSVTVLKDKAAIKLYGDKGKNGVLVIQLKNN